MDELEFKKMGQLVTDTIHPIARNAQLKVDTDFKDAIVNFIYIVTKIFVILNVINQDNKNYKLSDKVLDSQILLWQGGNSLIGSLQLIRQGYILEPQIIMRYAVENLAMVLSFYTNESKYNSYINLKLSGEKCIGEAKKLVTQIGSIYGLLSQIAHPSRKTSGYIYLPKKDELGTLLIGGGVTDYTLHRIKFNLAILNYLSTIYWSSTELIFSSFIDEYAFWDKDGDKMKWAPKKNESDRYNMSEKLFKEAIKELEINESERK